MMDFFCTSHSFKFFQAEENQNKLKNCDINMRSSRVLAEKVKTEKRMVSQKDSNEQEEKAHREKGQATRRCPIPPPHALRIFFLLHVFLMSVQQFENFFDDRRVHLQWCVKRATTV